MSPKHPTDQSNYTRGPTASRFTLDGLIRKVPATSLNFGKLGINPKTLIEENCARIPRRVKDRAPAHNTPILVAGYGPSLRTHWEMASRLPVVMTCSGSHAFLLERDIVPTYHVESDPHAWKRTLLGKPHSKVQYYISSICDPTYFDVFDMYGLTDNVTLWHMVLDGTGEEINPRNEWLFPGFGTVGNRAVRIAHWLGYRTMHLVGFDCSFPSVHEQHAGRHTGQFEKEEVYVEVDGREFLTSEHMLYQVRLFFDDIDQLEGVNYQLYGSGLLAAVDKVRLRRKPREFLPTGVMI